MVECSSCGKDNAEDAEYCIKCGASLRAVKLREKREDCFGGPDRPEDECFGLPYAGAIAGIIAGLVIIFLGLSIVFRWHFWWYLLPLVGLIIGLLIIIGALYSIRRRQTMA